MSLIHYLNGLLVYARRLAAYYFFSPIVNEGFIELCGPAVFVQLPRVVKV